MVYDAQDTTGVFHIYLSDLAGHSTSLTQGQAGLPTKSEGYPTFDGTGQYIVFAAEEPQHYVPTSGFLSDPGVGLYFNLWATDRAGSHFWKLTNVPIKQTLNDGIPTMAILHPFFSLDGKQVYWTERYGDEPVTACQNVWGDWHIQRADWSVQNGVPALTNETTVYTPAIQGAYVTVMGMLNAHTLEVAGNLSGQDAYGMDQYTYDMTSGTLTDLTNTPTSWEEDSSIAPGGQSIVYMSNATSPYPLDVCNPDWRSQPRERDYWSMAPDGSNKVQLTHFNDAWAPEYTGYRTLTVASAYSHDGRSLVGTLILDTGVGSQVNLSTARLVLMTFASGPPPTATTGSVKIPSVPTAPRAATSTTTSVPTATSTPTSTATASATTTATATMPGQR